MDGIDSHEQEVLLRIGELAGEAQQDYIYWLFGARVNDDLPKGVSECEWVLRY